MFTCNIITSSKYDNQYALVIKEWWTFSWTIFKSSTVMHSVLQKSECFAILRTLISILENYDFCFLSWILVTFIYAYSYKNISGLFSLIFPKGVVLLLFDFTSLESDFIGNHCPWRFVFQVLRLWHMIRP